jgi:hypothetical protein
MVAAIVALTVVPFAGCGGGGDDHAQVEANLQHYLIGLARGEARFPIGAGSPRVKDNGCFKLEKGSVWPNPLDQPLPPRLALWNCVVKFGTIATPVTVAVDDSTEVVAATPGAMLSGSPSRTKLRYGDPDRRRPRCRP